MGKTIQLLRGINESRNKITCPFCKQFLMPLLREWKVNKEVDGSCSGSSKFAGSSFCELQSSIFVHSDSGIKPQSWEKFNAYSNHTISKFSKIARKIWTLIHLELILCNSRYLRPEKERNAIKSSSFQSTPTPPLHTPLIEIIRATQKNLLKYTCLKIHQVVSLQAFQYYCMGDIVSVSSIFLFFFLLFWKQNFYKDLLEWSTIAIFHTILKLKKAPSVLLPTLAPPQGIFLHKIIKNRLPQFAKRLRI